MTFFFICPLLFLFNPLLIYSQTLFLKHSHFLKKMARVQNILRLVEQAIQSYNIADASDTVMNLQGTLTVFVCLLPLLACLLYVFACLNLSF
jgi:hypothetical protein